MNDVHALGIALALGLLVGVERGWKTREVKEGTRVAGVRTFGLFGLLGGVGALLTTSFEAPALLAGTFVGLAVLSTAGYIAVGRKTGSFGMTTEVAALLVFTLGALAVSGKPLEAAIATVAMLVLLRTKEAIHGWVEKLRPEEMSAAVVLLLISVVVLPLLPREPVDPWGVIVPYDVWWMVVLIAGLSFLGYVAVRIIGPRKGLIATAVLGGLVSSTAVTVTFSRLAKETPQSSSVFAAGVSAACGIMPVRVLAMVAVANAALVPRLVAPTVGMAVGAAIAAVLLGVHGRNETAKEVPLRNPLELGMALRLALLIVLIRLLAEGLKHWFGEVGIYLLAAVSGIADVDAVTLPLARLAKDGLDADVVVLGIMIALVANTVAKAILAFTLGGRAMGLRTSAALGASITLGAVGLLLPI